MGLPWQPRVVAIPAPQMILNTPHHFDPVNNIFAIFRLPGTPLCSVVVMYVS